MDDPAETFIAELTELVEKFVALARTPGADCELLEDLSLDIGATTYNIWKPLCCCKRTWHDKQVWPSAADSRQLMAADPTRM